MRNIAHKATGSDLTADEFNDIPAEEENIIIPFIFPSMDVILYINFSFLLNHSLYIKSPTFIFIRVTP